MPGKELDPYTSPEAFLGAELRLRREARGWSQTKLASVAHMTGSRIAQIELCLVPATLANATALDVALETGGLFERLHRFAITSYVFPDWVQRYVDLERTATSISVYAPTVVPGLLQTEGYMRALMREGRPRDREDEVESRFQARLQRQEIIRRAKPPALWFILEEEVLRRPVGGTEAMVEQLKYLAELAENPAVVIQIIRTGVGAHSLLGGELYLLDHADKPRVAYVEATFTGQLLEDPDRVTEYAVAYDLCRTRACDRSESALLIRAAMEDLQQ
ncbi:helix-turn-helix domain-containing protein [Streptomyces sp. NPDC088261]|uniref:helix-turn-helix domain-containing protein n=1 Tax=Streptomyces sp. NPDC088261 TaxID=3365851 RepID=UPI003824D542